MTISNCKIMWSSIDNLTTILICTQSIIMNQHVVFNNISLQNISKTDDFNVSFFDTLTNSSLNTTSSLLNYTAPISPNASFPLNFFSPSPSYKIDEVIPSPSRLRAPSPSPSPIDKVNSITPAPSYILMNGSSIIENQEIISTDENKTSSPNNDTLTKKNPESLIAIPIILVSIMLMLGLIFLLFKRKNKKNRIGCDVLTKKSEENYKASTKKTIFIGRPKDNIEQFIPDTPKTLPHPPNEAMPLKNQQSQLPPLPPPEKKEEANS